MFDPVAEQLDNVRRWNEERGWGFTERDFEAIDVTPVSHTDPLVVDVVAVYLDGDDELDPVRRTADELWAVASELYPNSWCWDEKCWDLSLVGRKHVRLLYGIAHRPGIRRVTLDLGAHWDPVYPTRSIDVRSTDSAHAELLAAAAHFPYWVRSMDGTSVPYVLLSGYQVTLVEQESWRRLPCLSWNESRSMLSLTAHWADIYGPRWSSPVCVGRSE
jgi:hypothetical protein